MLRNRVKKIDLLFKQQTLNLVTHDVPGPSSSASVTAVKKQKLCNDDTTSKETEIADDVWMSSQSDDSSSNSVCKILK